jgi:hypothetical protein
LDVYLRTPDLPKDDIARALVARGRARKGAGQRLLLMASHGLCNPEQMMYSADCGASSSLELHTTLRRLSDSFNIRSVQSRASVILAQGARRPSALSRQSTTRLIFPSSRCTLQASPPSDAFHQRSGTALQALSPDTSSARGFLYLPSIAILRSVTSSTQSTSTYARIRTTGTGHSTSLIGSRWTHSSRAESELSEFTGLMMVVICLKSCQVRVDSAAQGRLANL